VVKGMEGRRRAFVELMSIICAYFVASHILLYSKEEL